MKQQGQIIQPQTSQSNQSNSSGKSKEMQQRKAGRPSGTDGSDFSYRMVVDSRYTKVAKGKSRLKNLIFIQGIFQLIELFYVALPISKGKDPNILAVSSSVIGLISLLIGELGRRHSRGGFLKFYLAMSTITVLLSISCAFSSSSTLEVIQNPSAWETKKFELIETFVLLLGLLVQMFTISTVIPLISNMSPPKKAS